MTAVDTHWKVEGPYFEGGGLTMVGSDESENFWDFDPLDRLKSHSLNSDFKDLSINEI